MGIRKFLHDAKCWVGCSASKKKALIEALTSPLGVGIYLLNKEGTLKGTCRRTSDKRFVYVFARSAEPIEIWE